MKAHNPDLVLLLGHYNKDGAGTAKGNDVPSVAKWALDSSDCSFFKGAAGAAPYGANNTAASRLKFIVGHKHCNCMTSFDLTLKDKCLLDDALPEQVDGFIIGSHGMAWDPWGAASCPARFGLPVLTTDNGKLTVSYAKLSLETTSAKCSIFDFICQRRAPAGHVTPIDQWTAFFGITPAKWRSQHTGPYGAGILTDKMDTLLQCLTKKGTNTCSKDKSIFDQWYSLAMK